MNKIIDVSEICFAYPGESRFVIDHCSFSISEGELLSILGPNGAGKSTLLNCLCNLVTPQTGTISVEGKNITTLARRDVARVIGYVQQTQKATFSYTVFDYVLMGRAPNIGLFENPSSEDKKLANEALATMGIAHLAASNITEISGGERQQAAIARAVAQNPKVILFDEPTAHLDYGNQIRTLGLIKSLQDKGFAVIMTTHNPDHCIMLGGSVALLNREGKLVTGSCSELLTQERLRKVYNTNLRVVYVEEVGREVCIPEAI